MRWITIIIIAMLLTSCSTTQIVEPTTQSHDTLWVYDTHYDSIYVHDSICQVVEHKGDTVLIEKDVWRIEYREHIVTDSVYISKCDTLTNIVKVNELTRTQRAEIRFGKACFYIIIIIVFVLLVKRCFQR